jgi:hypothetical protein
LLKQIGKHTDFGFLHSFRQDELRRNSSAVDELLDGRLEISSRKDYNYDLDIFGINISSDPLNKVIRPLSSGYLNPLRFFYFDAKNSLGLTDHSNHLVCVLIVSLLIDQGP